MYESWARAPKHTHAKWQAKKKCTRVKIYTRAAKARREEESKKKTIGKRKRNNYQPRHIQSDHENGTKRDCCNTLTLEHALGALREWKKSMRNATEGLCSAATYYLLKGVCDETDRFNSHHVVSHAYNYPLSIYSQWNGERQSEQSLSVRSSVTVCSILSFIFIFLLHILHNFEYVIGVVLSCLVLLCRFYDLQIGKWIFRWLWMTNVN